MDGEITLIRNQTISVRLIDNTGNYGGAATSNPNKIDTLAPTVTSLAVGEVTTEKISVRATATDANATSTSCQSGVYSYSFYNSKSGQWSAYQTNTSYSVSSLSPGIEYTIKVKARDKAGNISSEYGIKARTPYKVSYNANGGSGAPAAQAKTHGTNLKLSSSVPTRAGYIFKGWATSSSGAVSMQPGGTYSGNANITYYAVWETAPTYSIMYDANGGSSAPATQKKIHGVDLKLSSTVPTRTGYRFLGWTTTRDVFTTGGTLQPGQSISMNDNIILYAYWQMLQTYSIRYDANGGSGAPATQIKTEGVDLTLSSTVPTRTGYSFMGWTISKNQPNAGMYYPGRKLYER